MVLVKSIYTDGFRLEMYLKQLFNLVLPFHLVQKMDKVGEQLLQDLTPPYLIRALQLMDAATLLGV